ncbi:DUF4400 domain-containing protein (plasmid) [Methylomonas sp. MED-D]|uniref:DUF4400 domain-containing protein n=1 Tax=unclassified Methylomonas TaxID=2608980 RepID=UPI003CFF5523
MTKSLFVTFILWIAEVFLVAVLVSDRWLTDMQDTEDRMIVEYLGADHDRRIREEATSVFNALLVQTGIQQNVYHFFIPTTAEREKSVGFEHFGQTDYFPFVQSKLDVLFGTFYQSLRRLFLLLSWWPFLIASVIPSAVDGLIQRKIKQSNFDYSSPLAHRYSFYAVIGIVYLLLLGLTFPFPIPPQAMPIACVGIALAMNIYFAHTQKRV